MADIFIFQSLKCYRYNILMIIYNILMIEREKNVCHVVQKKNKETEEGQWPKRLKNWLNTTIM